jgi:hypothetical protein
MQPHCIHIETALRPCGQLRWTHLISPCRVYLNLPWLCSLSTNGPGGTCPIPFSLVPPPPLPPLHPVHRTGALFFLPPTAPRKLAFQIDDVTLRAQRLSTRSRVFPPTRRNLASDTKATFSVEQHFVLLPIFCALQSLSASPCAKHTLPGLAKWCGATSS